MPLAGLVGVLGLLGFAAVETARIERLNPPQGRFVAVGAWRLHYTERQPRGPAIGTVLLLHGASGNQADVMLALGDRLAARGFRVIAPDRPGHGWSDRPDGEADASPARQAVLIRQGLRAIGIGHAIVLGHSWSGALAVDFALDQADFTDGLVLVAPVTHPWPGGVAWYYGPAASPLLGPIFTRLVALPVGLLSLGAGVVAVFAPAAAPPDYAARTELALLLRPREFMANAQDVAHLKAYVEVQAPRMGGLKVPTAIVTGDRDGVVLTRLHSFGSLRDMLPGVGHSPHWADPDAVVEAVLEVARRGAARSEAEQP